MSSDRNPIRVLIVDDQTLMLDGLSSILQTEADIEVVGTSEDGEHAVELAKELQPDVIVMDIEMPRMDGITATKKILETNSAIKVIALSSYEDIQHVAKMFEAGAAGYLLKKCAADDLSHAIRAVSSNLTFMSPQITATVIEKLNDKLEQTEDASIAVLTQREQQVLKLVTTGMASKVIAIELGVSIRTIEAYRHAIMHKLDLHSIPELTKFALQKGLTEMDI